MLLVSIMLVHNSAKYTQRNSLSVSMQRVKILSLYMLYIYCGGSAHLYM